MQPTRNLPNLVVMGVSGCGKSTLGQALAQQLAARYVEGDDLHPPHNVERMRAGIALTDDDRREWLDTIAAMLRDACREDRALVVTCSALKRSYRDLLRGGDPGLQLVFVHGDHALLARRIGARSGHYMPPSLLRSQLDTLEIPGADEQPLAVDIATSTADQAVAVLRGIGRTLRPA